MLYFPVLYKLLKLPGGVLEPSPYQLLVVDKGGLSLQGIETALLRRKRQLHHSLPGPEYIPLLPLFEKQLDEAAATLLDSGRRSAVDQQLLLEAVDDTSLRQRAERQQRIGAIKQVLEDSLDQEGALSDAARVQLASKLVRMGIGNQEVKTLLAGFPYPAPMLLEPTAVTLGFFSQTVGETIGHGHLAVNDRGTLLALAARLGIPQRVAVSIIDRHLGAGSPEETLQAPRAERPARRRDWSGLWKKAVPAFLVGIAVAVVIAAAIVFWPKPRWSSAIDLVNRDWAIDEYDVRTLRPVTDTPQQVVFDIGPVDAACNLPADLRAGGQPARLIMQKGEAGLAVLSAPPNRDKCLVFSCKIAGQEHPQLVWEVCERYYERHEDILQHLVIELVDRQNKIVYLCHRKPDPLPVQELSITVNGETGELLGLSSVLYYPWPRGLEATFTKRDEDKKPERCKLIDEGTSLPFIRRVDDRIYDCKLVLKRLDTNRVAVELVASSKWPPQALAREVKLAEKALADFRPEDYLSRDGAFEPRKAAWDEPDTKAQQGRTALSQPSPMAAVQSRLEEASTQHRMIAFRIEQSYRLQVMYNEQLSRLEERIKSAKAAAQQAQDRVTAARKQLKQWQDSVTEEPFVEFVNGVPVRKQRRPTNYVRRLQQFQADLQLEETNLYIAASELQRTLNDQAQLKAQLQQVAKNISQNDSDRQQAEQRLQSMREELRALAAGLQDEADAKSAQEAAAFEQKLVEFGKKQDAVIATKKAELEQALSDKQMAFGVALDEAAEALKSIGDVDLYDPWGLPVVKLIPKIEPVAR